MVRCSPGQSTPAEHSLALRRSPATSASLSRNTAGREATARLVPGLRASPRYQRLSEVITMTPQGGVLIAQHPALRRARMCCLGRGWLPVVSAQCRRELARQAGWAHPSDPDADASRA